jgi:hypothetical protein
MTAAEMTDALVLVNDRLAAAAELRGIPYIRFFCECGNCVAEEVPLSLDEHEEIRAREDLIYAAGHEAPRVPGSRHHEIGASSGSGSVSSTTRPGAKQVILNRS